MGVGLGLHTSGSTLNGVFITAYEQHRIGYANNLSTDAVIGGTTITKIFDIIWGTGSGQHNGDNINGNVTLFKPSSVYYMQGTMS